MSKNAWHHEAPCRVGLVGPDGRALDRDQELPIHARSGAGLTSKDGRVEALVQSAGCDLRDLEHPLLVSLHWSPTAAPGAAGRVGRRIPRCHRA